jgi:hypothetical protein
MCLRSLCKSCEAAAFDPTVNICSRRAYPTRAARRGPARLQEHTPSEKGKVRCSRRGAANRKHYCGCSVTLECFVILDGLTKHWLHGRRRRISGASRTLKGIAGALTIESLTVRFPPGNGRSWEPWATAVGPGAEVQINPSASGRRASARGRRCASVGVAVAAMPRVDVNAAAAPATRAAEKYVC